MSIKIRALMLLESGEKGTKHDIARMLDCSMSSANRVLLELHKEHKIHVLAWTRSRNLPIPIYKIGNNKGKRKPAPLTKAEQNANRRIVTLESVWFK